MERTGALATGVPRRDPGTVRLTRVGVVIAALGALLVVIDPFGLATAGLVIAVVGALLAARGGVGHSWYWMIAGGAAVAVFSRLMAEGAQTLGGWLSVVGCLMILIGASLGYPLASDLEE
ncbi:MAG: hypothetical protein ACRDLQ_12125 [Solirubrobacterales bacterium]